MNSFKDICHELMTTYSMKNSDYGDSFGRTFGEYGLVSAVVRIADKYHRIAELTKKERLVDESIEDTLLDLAGYCIMTVMELRKDK